LLVIIRKMPTRRPEPKRVWIDRSKVDRIPGALKSSAYVARASKHEKKHGKPPPWARKETRVARGRTWKYWVFDKDHIKREVGAARETARMYMSPKEVADTSGASRRAVLDWFDSGILRGKVVGGERWISRSHFKKSLPKLQERLQKPNVVALRARFKSVPRGPRKAPAPRRPSRERYFSEMGKLERRARPGLEAKLVRKAFQHAIKFEVPAEDFRGSLYTLLEGCSVIGKPEPLSGEAAAKQRERRGGQLSRFLEETLGKGYADKLRR
jgi:hypothetical protein